MAAAAVGGGSSKGAVMQWRDAVVTGGERKHAVLVSGERDSGCQKKEKEMWLCNQSNVNPGHASIQLCQIFPQLKIKGQVVHNYRCIFEIECKESPFDINKKWIKKDQDFPNVLVLTIRWC